MGESNIERLLKELVTLQSKEFDSDERRIIDFAFSHVNAMQSDILKGREYLTKEDLLNFNYSPDMFDDKRHKNLSIHHDQVTLVAVVIILTLINMMKIIMVILIILI